MDLSKQSDDFLVEQLRKCRVRMERARLDLEREKRLEREIFDAMAQKCIEAFKPLEALARVAHRKNAQGLANILERSLKDE